MSSIIGYNAHIRYMQNYEQFVATSQRIAPAYNLAYVDSAPHLSYAKLFADSQAGQTVIRLWHSLDGAFFQKPTAPGDTRYYIVSPQDYLDAYGAYATGKMILNVLNEPNGFAETSDTMRRVTWMSELLTIAARRKLQLVVYNWGDRHPEMIGDQWSGADDDILKIMANYPDLFYMGMHLYGPDDIADHLAGYVKRCETLKIVPNRVIVTEYGLDSTGGAENGYKSRKWTGKQYADWQIGQVKGALKPFIDSGVLVGLCTYCVGNSGGWANFDVETDSEYFTTIEAAVKAGELAPLTTKPVDITKPEYTPAPVEVGKRYAMRSPAGYRRILHRAPMLGSESVASIPDGSIVMVLEEKAVKADWWRKVSYTDKGVTLQGWISMDGGLVKFQSLTTEFTPVTPPPAINTPEPAENAGNSGLQPITVLTKADIQKQIIFKELELAQLRDLLARAA